MTGPRWLPGLVVALASFVAVLGATLWNRGGARRETVLTEREAELVQRGDGRRAVLVFTDPPAGTGNRVTVERLVALGADTAGLALPIELGGVAVRGFVVLELGGPVWRRNVERAIRDYVAAVVAPDTLPARQDSLLADFRRVQEEVLTRLVLADVGIDGAALARQYPDAARHLILPAEFALERRARGPAPALRIHGVQLPVPRAGGTGVPVRYRLTVATGRRFEPWVTGLEVLESRAPDSLRLH